MRTQIPAQMKAMVLETFGGAEQIKVAQIPTPQPLTGEVLVQVAYASVNPVDWKIREGFLKDVLPHQFPLIPGWDVSGVIVEVGNGVKDFKVGDRIYSYARKPTVQFGTYAEYVALEEKSVALLPKTLTLAEGASLPLVALTAWQALFDGAKLKADEKCLIHAGAGGVGGLAIQFAKEAGARVFTTATARNHGYVKELGADRAIDYSEEPFAATMKVAVPAGVDVVLDTVGGATLKESYGLVKRGGHLISIVEAPDEIRAKELGITVGYMFVSPSGAQLREVGQLIEGGRVRPLAIEIMPLEEAAAAQERIRTRHHRGKIVLKVRGD